ncbi:MFS transporter [Govanella unica]|uniref:MFS transporter n=1 Tax=Govanella unica TaxID=2975056 RepID=A0A9X3TW03_9PROT|nr:MFS transporter [Govania unica]MDA5192457.1 MFS transporter [Govania unica]
MTDARHTRWLTVAALVLTGVVSAAQMFKYAPALPLIRAELGIGLVAGGWLISLANMLGATVGVAAGLMADRFGQRRMLLSGLLIFALSTGLGAFAASVPLLFVSRFFEGCGFLCIVISAASLIARECQPQDRSLALTIWGCYNPIGGTLLLVAAPFVMQAVGWRGLWLALSVLTLVTLLLVLLARPRARPSGLMPVAISANLRLAAAVPGSWLIGASFGLYTLQYIVVMSWLPSVMVETRHMPLGTAGLLTALAVGVNIIGNLIAGWGLKQNIRHGVLIGATGALMAASAAVIFSDLPDLWRYLGCISLSLWGGMLPGSVLASVPVLAPSPSQIGAVNGFAVQGSNIGLLLGPPIAGAIVALTGTWNNLLLLFLVASAAIMVAGMQLARLEARANRDPHEA